MTAGRGYSIGLGLVATATLVMAALVPGDLRRGSLTALGLAFVIQAPLGWLVVRSLGTPRLMGVWGLGIVVRFALLGITALLLTPLFGWPLVAFLLPLAGVLVALLGVESVALLLGRKTIEE
jgi:hypothetical protein